MKGEENAPFIEVVVNLPLTKLFHYRVPEHLKSSVEVGKRVLVPLGKRKVTGYVVGVAQKPEVSEIKDVLDVLDDQPLFTLKLLSFYKWVSDYYFSPLGWVVKTALPGNLSMESRQVLSPTEEGKRYLALKDNSP
ncbi:MAG: primosomal protein N', partial [Deltaproteobacteria bacterium]|nr:primosomal protein N' [Deltaproteobacteria bacterium]